MNLVTAVLRTGLWHCRTLFGVALKISSSPKPSETCSVTEGGMIKWLCYGYRAGGENRWCRSGFHGNRLQWRFCCQGFISTSSLGLGKWSWVKCDAAVSYQALARKLWQGTCRDVWIEARGLGPPVVFCGLTLRGSITFWLRALSFIQPRQWVFSPEEGLWVAHDLAYQVFGFQFSFYDTIMCDYLSRIARRHLYAFDLAYN